MCVCVFAYVRAYIHVYVHVCVHVCVYVHGWVCVIAEFIQNFLLVGGRNFSLKVRSCILHLMELNTL